MKLNDIQINDFFQINDLSNLNPLVKRRLKDFGITEGKCVCIKQFCPFGGPCMIESSGQLVGLRRKYASCIVGERL